MNRTEFQELMEQHYGQILGINNVKGHDYAGESDALRNFKEQAERLGLTPTQVWGVLAEKHWSAIETYVKEGAVQSEPIEGRLHDVILYSFLLLALIEDAKTDPVDAKRQREVDSLKNSLVVTPRSVQNPPLQNIGRIVENDGGHNMVPDGV